MIATVTRLAAQIGICMGVILWSAYAVAAGQRAFLPELFFSTDTDGFEVRKVRVGFSPDYKSIGEYFRITAEEARFVAPGWSGQRSQLGLGLRGVSSDGVAYESNLYLNHGVGHDSMTFDGQMNYAVGDRSRAEFSILRDQVESQLGLQTDRHLARLAAGLETQWSTRWSSVAYAGFTRYSDGNSRQLGKARVIFDLFPEQGVTLQGWFQTFRNTDQLAAQSAYFNPNRYRETLMVLGIRQRLPGFLMRFRAGVGTQNVSDVGASAAQFADLMLESKEQRDYWFRTTIGYKRSAGVASDDYRYRSLLQEIIIPLDGPR